MDWAQIKRECAVRYSVSPEIHGEDMLLQFILNHPAFREPEEAVRYYFSDGAESAGKLRDIIDRNMSPGLRRGRYTILEFASGYGMVTRHLHGKLEGADIVSCDIHAKAVQFIRSTLQAKAITSRHHPEDLAFDTSFDVVFALSFFSHVPEATFGRWLKTLFAAVRQGGLLVFTTHGLASQKNFGEIVIPESGYWFMPSSEQDDLDSTEYGSAVTTPDYVIGELFRSLRAPIREFKHAYWWGHQDLYVIAKT
jgi:cyclopropane fatty-acyl-phospholipid synthase-like methyltransferase